MDVYLLVYDLSRGLAQQMSMGLLGFQLDAVYHTSIQLNGLEYVYDGNVVAIMPGSSHLGQPMQKLHLGNTELPMDVIEEYLDSLREVYTVEAYDLWRHNCNNFSNDLAMFLLGKAIPDHITNMPQDVLDSPFGQLLMPTLNQQINANRRAGGILGIQEQTPGSSVKPQSQLHHRVGRVHVVSSLGELDQMLGEATKSCAVVFFTSATCPPCRTLDPLYDELAAEFGEKATLIKVDISQAFDVGSRYSVSATPTFVTFLQGQQENRWSGADPSALRGNIQLLVQMAWSPHPHQALDLPSFSNPNAMPVVFSKTPPLPKLLAKMGPTATNPAIQSLKHFIETRSSQGPAEATLPDMDALTALVRGSLQTLPPDLLFALVDLLRCGLVDPRLSGCLAEEPGQHTVASILEHVASLSDASKCPYALRLVTLQMACNLFTSPLYPGQILSNKHHDGRLRRLVTQLVASSFLDDDAGGGGRSSNVRVAAASLLFNVALANGRRRCDGPGDALPEADQVELAASALHSIAREEVSVEALQGVLLALGHLAYRLPLDGELAELLRAMDAAEVVLAKEKAFPRLGLVREVGAELLGKGLGMALIT